MGVSVGLGRAAPFLRCPRCETSLEPAAGTLVVRYAAPGSKSVTSVVQSAVEDSNAANNTATQTTQVDPKPAPTGASCRLRAR